MHLSLPTHRLLAALLLILGAILLSGCAGQYAGRTEQSFNQGWSFRKGGDAQARWQPVQVPHDWVIAGPFDPEADGSQGKLPWKTEGTYRKTFTLDPEALAEDRRAVLLFDGVMSSPTVTVNGQDAGSWGYGYNSFWLDITDLARPGENTVSVHASNKELASRWYPGGGINRKVTLLTLPAVHVPVWGVWVTTPEITDDHAAVEVRTEITSTAAEPRTTTLSTALHGPEGRVVAQRAEPVTVAPGETTTITQRFEINSPKRWDIDHPHLYRAETTLGGEHASATRFGIRTFEWTADDGFHLNGRRVQLEGVCLHHDNGPLGAVTVRDAEARKLRIMKDMGVNAIRTSHNAPAPEILELCDEMGLLVIDELFDKYGRNAGAQVSTAEYVNTMAEAEVRNFIRRDRNHPSVVLWSIANEETNVLRDHDGMGARHVETMVGYFKKYDPTRPTNMAMHITGSAYNGVLDAIETMGWNYARKYEHAEQHYAHIPQIYTESASAFITRGHYKFPHPAHRNDFGEDFHESSYGYTSARWSDIPDVEFLRMERDTHVAGEFVWTGFDYLGEPTPHTQQARSSYFGIVDLAGIPKDSYYLYRGHWNEHDHTVHILPHWTWPDRVGKNVPVYVYTDGDSAELFLNGKSLGRREKTSGDRPSTPNLAFGRPARASSQEIRQDRDGNVQAENRADLAFDSSPDTRWCADGASTPQWLAVDLGEPKPFEMVIIDWESGADRYTYELQVSDDGQTWSTIGGSDTDLESGSRTIIESPGEGRHIRVLVTQVASGSWASIRELSVLESGSSADALRDPYYDVMDRYRLRWEDVVYMPGELRAVAYKDGGRIGEATVETAGPAATIRLTPEQRTIAEGGSSLAYVLVEAVDVHGTRCPQDMRTVTFSVDGPATIAGIGNGNPRGLDPFQDDTHPLFYGKAVVILRAADEGAGTVTLRAQAPGLAPATTQIRIEQE